MYEYEFKDENIVSEYRNVTIKCDDCYYMVNIVFTDKNMLIFYDLNSNNILKSRNVQVIEKYALILKQKLDEIDSKISDDNTILICNNRKAIVYNFNIEKDLKI